MKTAQNKALRMIDDTTTLIAGDEGSFRFRLERSENEYELPLIQDLPVKQVRALSKADGDEGIDAILDLFDALAPGLTDEATQRDLSLIMEAWTEASNITLGE